jgi:hypothetical protein
LRRESINSLPCGQESGEIEEVVMPEAEMRSGMIDEQAI